MLLMMLRGDSSLFQIPALGAQSGPRVCSPAAIGEVLSTRQRDDWFIFLSADYPVDCQCYCTKKTICQPSKVGIMPVGIPISVGLQLKAVGNDFYWLVMHIARTIICILECLPQNS